MAQTTIRTPALLAPGTTIHTPKLRGGGGADGRYWVVVASESYTWTTSEDDADPAEIHYRATLRPATAAEATRCAERSAARRAATMDRAMHS